MLSSPYSASPPVTTNLLYAFVCCFCFVLLFICFIIHIWVKSYGICLSLSDLFLLREITSRSINIANDKILSLLGLSSISLYICTTSLSVNRHLGCFHILEIVNNAAINIGVRISIWISVFIFFQTNTQKWNSWIIWQLLLSFFKPPHVFHSGYTNLYFHQQRIKFPFPSHLFQYLLFLVFWWYSF